MEALGSEADAQYRLSSMASAGTSIKAAASRQTTQTPVCSAASESERKMAPIAGVAEARMVPTAKVTEIHVERASRSSAVWPSSGTSAKYGVQ
jgi:hypothetical protein